MTEVTGPLLSVRDLSLSFRSSTGRRAAVLDAVSLDLGPRETLGLVGESGSGKSVLALALLRVLGAQAEITRGAALLDGEDLLRVDDRGMRALRGKMLAIISQNPASSLNPLRRIGVQIADVLRAHGDLSVRDARHRAAEMLDWVGIADAAARAEAYPFELSGGMKQRVMIALALAAGPRLLIADEATTGLDVTTQAMVLDLIREQAQARGMSTLLITHDLALAAERCDRIAVIHAGQIVEWAPAVELVTQPRHPYTRALLRATPRAGMSVADLQAIPGRAPDPAGVDLPACRFYGRCELRTDLCQRLSPPRNLTLGAGHMVACHHSA